MDRLPGWYTPQMFALDQALKGVWWRCPRHGLTTDPVVLSSCVMRFPSVYCADPECTEHVLRVHGCTSADGSDRTGGFDQSANEARRVESARRRHRANPDSKEYEVSRAILLALEDAPAGRLRRAALVIQVRELTGRELTSRSMSAYLARLTAGRKVTKHARGIWGLA